MKFLHQTIRIAHVRRRPPAIFSEAWNFDFAADVQPRPELLQTAKRSG
jgi:hypothetical protein